ncbi:hypothetical protein Q7P37_006540 [Cladosporium fusiforme]
MFVKLLSLILFLPRLLFAQVLPFFLDGAIESATADTADFNTGGTISVGGKTITIPKNLQFQFPAAWVPFKDIAGGAYNGHEVSIFGNYVGTKAIAGLVSISQLQGATDNGIIDTLGTDGKITLKGGQVIRINDPNAVYSAGYDLHPAYTADDENPSIIGKLAIDDDNLASKTNQYAHSAFSGYPMCVPRSASDPKCPSSNRVDKRVDGTPLIIKPADPLSMVPFAPGDYLTFSGIKVGGEIIAYEIVAENVQVSTETAGAPTYIRVEDAIIGTIDTQDPANVAPADTRFIGYTSDKNVGVTISRMEVDSCTGVTKEVLVGSASPIGVRNKWTWRAGSTSPTKYAREYIVRANSGTQTMKINNITAGQYVAPVTEWIFPEPGVPGLTPAKLDFTTFIHLVDGVGPDEANPDNRFGQLDPFPDSTAPTAKTCTGTTTPPTTSTPPTTGTDPATLTANAGAAQTIRPGVLVTLSGTSSGATDATYSWALTTGTGVTLSNANTAKATFTAPASKTLVSYTFTLTVKSASAGTSATSTVTITNDPSIADLVVIDSYTVTSQGGGTISVTAHTNVIDLNIAKLSVSLLNPNAGTPTLMTSAGAGKFTFTLRGSKAPSGGIQVTSSANGKATITKTTQKRRRSWMK